MLYSIINLTDDKVLAFQKYLDEHWKKGHVFVKSKELLDFQHYNHGTHEYNFMIAINSQTKEIDGIVGWIPLAHFDDNLYDNGDYWGAIWKVRTDVENDEIKMLGLLLWEKLIDKREIKTFGAISISEVAKRFYKISRFRMGIMNHYYILREQQTPYSIAVAPVNERQTDVPTQKYIKRIELSQECSVQPFYKPLKSITFLINRYKNHPVYKYDFLQIGEQCLLVIRKVRVNGHNVLRVIDCLGNLDDLPDLYPEFQLLLKQEDAEYIDFMNYGIDELTFYKMGFQKLEHDSDIVIPNYFEPFLQKNITVEVAFKSLEDYTVFKGDSDQDRPNIL